MATWLAPESHPRGLSRRCHRRRRCLQALSGNTGDGTKYARTPRVATNTSTIGVIYRYLQHKLQKKLVNITLIAGTLDFFVISLQFKSHFHTPYTMDDISTQTESQLAIFVKWSPTWNPFTTLQWGNDVILAVSCHDIVILPRLIYFL